MKVFFKKPLNILIVVTALFLILTSISITYYFIIFLPQSKRLETNLQTQIKKLQKDVSDTKDSIENPQYNSNTDTGDIEDKLDQIQSNMAEQQWEDEKRTSCESNGGKYLGNGSCCLTNCSNWLSQ